jgi:hypothetical protein
MEDQVTPSNPPRSPEQNFNVPLPRTITPELLEALKAQARENAIKQALEESSAAARSPMPQQSMVFPPLQGRNVPEFVEPPQFVYVRRNLTVAELIVVFALSCGLVLGIQGAWQLGSRLLPSIEIKVK